MPVGALFDILASLFSLIAVVLLIDQHYHKPRPYKMMWAIGLLAYGIAPIASSAGIIGHWNITTYDIWYYFGGILSAIFLGLGSFYLLGPRKIADIITAVTVVISLYAAIRIISFPVPEHTLKLLAASPTSTVENVKQFSVFPFDITLCAIILNIPGAIFLFGGAVWSGWNFWRQHQAGYRVLSMAFLALGAVFPSIANGLLRFGISDAAQIGDFLGAVAILVGLMISLDVFAVFRVPFTNVVLYKRHVTQTA